MYGENKPKRLNIHESKVWYYDFTNKTKYEDGDWNPAIYRIDSVIKIWNSDAALLKIEIKTKENEKDLIDLDQIEFLKFVYTLVPKGVEVNTDEEAFRNNDEYIPGLIVDIHKDNITATKTDIHDYYEYNEYKRIEFTDLTRIDFDVPLALDWINGQVKHSPSAQSGIEIFWRDGGEINEPTMFFMSYCWYYYGCNSGLIYIYEGDNH
jgi:hypothetical protein